MKKLIIAAALLAAPALAQDSEPQGVPSPNEIVAQAEPSEWIAIAAEDLLVMTLAPDRDGNQRRVVIQLIPPPFSEPWVANIRTLAKAHWWDGLAIVRVQDNYVVQWGDPDAEDASKAKPLPDSLRTTTQDDYSANGDVPGWQKLAPLILPRGSTVTSDGYSGFEAGWPVAAHGGPDWARKWPVHCYGMVGVGRGYSPDAGSGAELYTVIGHAPRHLDRNIALAGRVIEGIEHLSSLPRGTGPLGFYETADERVPVASILLASALPASEQPEFEYLSTDGETFARYADARANRRDPFFITPAGGADICNIPVPVRRVTK